MPLIDRLKHLKQLANQELQYFDRLACVALSASRLEF